MKYILKILSQITLIIIATFVAIYLILFVITLLYTGFDFSAAVNCFTGGFIMISSLISIPAIISFLIILYNEEFN